MPSNKIFISKHRVIHIHCISINKQKIKQPPPPPHYFRGNYLGFQSLFMIFPQFLYYLVNSRFKSQFGKSIPRTPTMSSTFLSEIHLSNCKEFIFLFCPLREKSDDLLRKNAKITEEKWKNGGKGGKGGIFTVVGR